MSPEGPLKSVTDPHLSVEEIRRRTTQSVVAVIFRGFGVRFVGFLGTVVLARLLVPAQFGVIALGIAITTVGSGLSDGGLSTALVRGGRTPTRTDLESAFGVNLLATVIVVAITAAIGVPLGKTGTVAAVMSLALPLNVIRSPGAILLERTLRYRVLVQAELTEVLVYNVWAVATVALGMGVWGVASAVVVRAAIGSGVVVVRGPVGLVVPRLDIARVRPILAFGMQTQGVEFVNLARDQGINVLMAVIGGAAALGFWALAWRLIQAIFVLFEALWRVSFPAIARLMESGEEVRSTIERALRLASGTTGVLLTPLAGAAPALISVGFGHQWAPSAKIIPLVSLGLMLNGPISAAGVGYLYAQGRAAFVLKQVLAHTIVGLIVTAGAVAAFGATGVGYGMLAASIVDYGFLVYVLGGREGIAVFGTTLPALALGLVAGAGTYVLATTLPRDVLTLAAEVVLAEGAYVILLFVFQRRLATEILRFGMSLVARSRNRAVQTELA